MFEFNPIKHSCVSIGYLNGNVEDKRLVKKVTIVPNKGRDTCSIATWEGFSNIYMRMKNGAIGEIFATLTDCETIKESEDRRWGEIRRKIHALS